MPPREVKYRVVVQDFATRTLTKIQRGFVETGKKVVRSAANMARAIGRIGAVLGAAGTGGLIGASIGASAKFEMLRLRLEAVTGSAKKANKMFAEMRKFAAATPLQLEDIVGARIMLEGIGVRGQAALEKVAEAAAAMNMPLRDAAAMIASMETEPLRRLGIEIKRSGESASIVFRDKVGRELKRTETGIMNIRRALLETFGMKFGGILGKASGTQAGLFSTLKDSVTELFAAVGDELAPTVKAVLGKAITAVKASTADMVRAAKTAVNILGNILGGDKAKRDAAFEYIGAKTTQAFIKAAAAAGRFMVEVAPDIGRGIWGGFKGFLKGAKSGAQGGSRLDELLSEQETLANGALARFFGGGAGAGAGAPAATPDKKPYRPYTTYNPRGKRRGVAANLAADYRYVGGGLPASVGARLRAQEDMGNFSGGIYRPSVTNPLGAGGARVTLSDVYDQLVLINGNTKDMGPGT